MRYPADQKENTRRQIVNAVACALRRDGIAASSIVPMMREAGLTQGAFYAHFANREELLVEVITLAVEQNHVAVQRWTESAARDGEDPGIRFIDSYLSRRHLEAREAGCIFAALGPELWRQGPAVRSAASRACEDIVAVLGGVMAPSRRAMAQPLYMMMAGVLSCARLLDDEVQQAAMLEQGRHAAFVLAGLQR